MSIDYQIGKKYYVCLSRSITYVELTKIIHKKENKMILGFADCQHRYPDLVFETYEDAKAEFKEWVTAQYNNYMKEIDKWEKPGDYIIGRPDKVFSND